MVKYFGFLHIVSCHVQRMKVLGLSYWLGWYSFLLVVWLVWLGHPLLCWTVVVGIDIFVLFSTFRENLSISPIKDDVSCGFFYRWALICCSMFPQSLIVKFSKNVLFIHLSEEDREREQGSVTAGRRRSRSQLSKELNIGLDP